MDNTAWKINGWNAKMEVDGRWFSYGLCHLMLMSHWNPSQQLITKLTPTYHLTMPTLSEIQRTNRAESSLHTHPLLPHILRILSVQGVQDGNQTSGKKPVMKLHATLWPGLFVGNSLPFMYPNHLGNISLILKTWFKAIHGGDFPYIRY